MNERRKSMMIIVAREFYQQKRENGWKVGDVYEDIKLYFKKEMK
jgi:hypothetical protein